VQTGNWGATTSQKMSVSTQWKEQSVTFSGLTTEKAFVVFQPGDFAGDISCKWVKVTHSEAPVMEIETEVHKETYTDGDFPFYAMGCTPPVINGAIHFVPTGDWSQFFVISERIKANQYEGRYVNSYFWRTNQQQEIDYIEESDGQFTLFEMKWNPKRANTQFPASFLNTYDVKDKTIITPENWLEHL
jgi:hypothetical protein